MSPPRRPAARKHRPPPSDEVLDEVADEVADDVEAGGVYEKPDTPDVPTGPWWREEDAGRPRPVAGGIAARTRKGSIGVTWWSRRFLESLEAVTVGGRVERGRSYARKGQVVDLHVGPGVVTATVQGSREDPYVVRLKMAVVPEEDWGRIVGALAARAGYAARMLAGELPHEVEEVFDVEGASLLPAPHARLVTECTCPDWENPCKHVAAVYYLLAEEFDRDPFSLLAWRGRGREEVLGELRALRREGARGAEPESTAGGTEPGAPASEVTTGDGDDLVARFWAAGPDLSGVRVRPEAAEVPAAVLRLAPRGTISVRGEDLADALAPLYQQIASAAAARARR
ncbi:MAG: SWIM zinc finger family protein [Acidimicrobiales bacterium]